MANHCLLQVFSFIYYTIMGLNLATALICFGVILQNSLEWFRLLPKFSHHFFLFLIFSCFPRRIGKSWMRDDAPGFEPVSIWDTSGAGGPTHHATTHQHQFSPLDWSNWELWPTSCRDCSHQKIQSWLLIFLKDLLVCPDVHIFLDSFL